VVKVYDSESLALLVEGTLPSFSVAGPGVAGVTGPAVVGSILLTSTTSYAQVIHAYSGTTLGLLGEIAPPQLQGLRYLLFSRGFGGRTLYVNSESVGAIYFGCRTTRQIAVFDLQTFEYLGAVSPYLLGGDGCPPFFQYLAPPDPPTRLRTSSAAGTVHLEWDPPANITDYEILVGSRSNATDIGEFRTYGKAFADFRGVPSATYYVRVRARNELGVAESAELRVTIP
jgi:hypothetical protein